MQRTRLFLAAISACAGSGIALPAAAQVPGQYVGSNSDEYQVTLMVYQNPKGKLFLTVVRDFALFYCDGKLLLTNGPPGTPPKIEGYGAAFVKELPIKDGAVTFAVRSNDLSLVTGTVTFDGDKASGRLVGYAALFAGSKTPPNDAEAKSCRTRDLKFTAQLKGPL